MKNQQRQELVEQAKEVRRKCYFMLENAPQEMSNVSLILNLLAATNKLLEYLENE